MSRWLVWTITLVVGALCFGPELRMLWSGPSRTWVIQPGTAVSVRLLRSLTSATAKPGQPFAAYVVSSEGVEGSAQVVPGTIVEGVCLAVRRATANGRPGYIRLALEGLRDSEGRFVPLETTTFSEWGYPYSGRSDILDGSATEGYQPDRPPAASATPNETVASAEALLPTEENIKFIVLKPSPIPSRFHVPKVAGVFP